MTTQVATSATFTAPAQPFSCAGIPPRQSSPASSTFVNGGTAPEADTGWFSSSRSADSLPALTTPRQATPKTSSRSLTKSIRVNVHRSWSVEMLSRQQQMTKRTAHLASLARHGVLITIATMRALA